MYLLTLLSLPPSLSPGRSRTGTGKTLAFGLPICEVVARNLEAAGRKNERGRAPSVIILAPTRELAKQCDDQLSRIGRPLGTSPSLPPSLPPSLCSPTLDVKRLPVQEDGAVGR